ncbi:MAG: hypothetical protein QS748_02430 [Candidatus Endonucleobacter bathymodioli]|uniref:Uncharacterized protein n=1 Tax=Candidatus Endonucleibacter bathymodioli TaxID=539814 RepID=A0AA90NTU8_9GAMM|nr:hypothetical protein [Candidatus Endonucleobacter bathymodioli]
MCHGRLKLLPCNIQVGSTTQLYHHYVTRGWQHIFSYSSRFGNLDRIDSLLSDFDLAALQEVDGGSFRTDFINQTEYLALYGELSLLVSTTK